MSTPDIVPRNDGEGSIGDSVKNWLSAFAKTIWATTQLNIANAATNITKDVSGNMVLTDAVTGAKTLADLASGLPGDVVGPGSATDNAMTLWDGATGKLVKNSVVTVDGSGNISTAGTVDGVDVSALESAYVGHATDGTIHYTEASINHTAIQNIGSNTHAQIDSHIGSTSNPHSVTHAQLGGVSADQHHNRQHGIGSTSDHTSATLAQLNALVSDATLDGSSASRTPTAHKSTHNSGGSDQLDHNDLGNLDSGNYLHLTSSQKTAALKEYLYFGPDTFNNNDNYYACANIAGTGARYFTIVIPTYALTIESIKIIGYASGTVSGVDIDFFSNYGGNGESITNHSESDTTSTYNFTANQHTEIDLKAKVFNSIAAGDRGGIYMDANGTGTTFRNLAVEVVITKG